jgi:hypothetical protein
VTATIEHLETALLFWPMKGYPATASLGDDEANRDHAIARPRTAGADGLDVTSSHGQRYGWRVVRWVANGSVVGRESS